jgi:non-homologous end joining protein Ku
MIRAKQKSLPKPVAASKRTPVKSTGNVVNIMDALKKSLEVSGGDGSIRRPRAPSKKPAEAPAAKDAARKPKARKAAGR